MRILVFGILVLLGFGCSVSNEPEFKKMTNFRVKKLGVNECKITSDIVFYNPNDMGCDVVATNINVEVNGVPSGSAKQIKKVKLKALSDFELPVQIEFNPKEIFKLNNGLFTGALKLLKEKTVEIHYKGFVTIDVLGVELPIEIDTKEEISLN